MQKFPHGFPYIILAYILSIWICNIHTAYMSVADIAEVHIREMIDLYGILNRAWETKCSLSLGILH